MSKQEWKLVPVDQPTDAMVDAIALAVHRGDGGSDIWAAAVAVAPMPPTVGDAPSFPELESLADLEYAQNPPETWGADHRTMWQNYQVAARNKMQLFRYAVSMRDYVASLAKPPSVGGEIEVYTATRLTRDGEEAVCNEHTPWHVVLLADHQAFTAAPLPPSVGGEPEVLRYCMYNEDGKFSAVEDARGYWCKHDDYAALSAQLATSQARVAELEMGLGAMLFCFDDGVGNQWSEATLDYARKLCKARQLSSAALAQQVTKHD